jgi:hypothetical protein
VTRARRQYDAVDPSNRLVVAELERRWNKALTMEAQVETELVTLQQRREESITEELKCELLSFAQDLPKLWDDPHRRRLTITCTIGVRRVIFNLCAR